MSASPEPRQDWGHCACPSDPCNTVIEGGIPTEALVAHVLVARYADHLPLYRQAQILARQGVSLERSTLSFWLGYAAAEVAPVVARLREMMLASTRIFADETVVPVLDRVAGGPSRVTSGLSRVTTGRGAAASRRRWFTAMRLAEGTSTPTRCLAAAAVSSSATATHPTRSLAAPSRPIRPSLWRSAGATCAGAFMIWPRPGHRSRRRR